MSNFYGGVHPEGFKDTTSKKAIETFPIPENVIIPLSQHTGKPAVPLVKIGQKVKTGQKIGQADGFISLPVHSSISGSIADIRAHHHSLGGISTSVIIESDGKDEWVDIVPHRDYFRLSPEALREIIKEAGITGLGGAAFPTHVKLSPPDDFKIDTIILNGCECEPYLTCDERIIIESPRQIIEGLKIIMFILDVKKGIFAIEDNKPQAIKSAEKEIRRNPNIEIKILKTKYPQGAEKQLIKTILKREVPSGKLPFNVGAVVSNVGTSFAIYEAVVEGKPLVDRVITVGGNGVERQKNLKVRIGTKFQDILDFCKIKKAKKIISGGPMMGISQYALDIPVIKGTSGIIVFDKIDEIKEKDCIRCSKCIQICPMRLSPTSIIKHIKKKEFLKTKDLNILDCIECGACAYECPAGIPLVQYIKWGKEEIKSV